MVERSPGRSPPPRTGLDEKCFVVGPRKGKGGGKGGVVPPNQTENRSFGCNRTR